MKNGYRRVWIAWVTVLALTPSHARSEYQPPPLCLQALNQCLDQKEALQGLDRKNESLVRKIESQRDQAYSNLEQKPPGPPLKGIVLALTAAGLAAFLCTKSKEACLAGTGVAAGAGLTLVVLSW